MHLSIYCFGEYCVQFDCKNFKIILELNKSKIKCDIFAVSALNSKINRKMHFEFEWDRSPRNLRFLWKSFLAKSSLNRFSFLFCVRTYKSACLYSLGVAAGLPCFSSLTKRLCVDSFVVSLGSRCCGGFSSAKH